MLCTIHSKSQLALTCTHESQWHHRGENSCSNEAPSPPFFLGGGGGQRVLHYSSYGENDTTIHLRMRRHTWIGNAFLRGEVGSGGVAKL